MKINKLTYGVVVALFVISALVSWNLYFKVYAQQDTVNISQFPKTIGEWTSEDLPITELEMSILETKNVFVRKYTNPKGDLVYLFIVYSQYNRKVSHPPEICYTGGGATILESVHDSVHGLDGRSIAANRLLVELNKARQVVFYWFKVGDTFTSNYWKQQWLIAMKSLLGKPSSSALVRLSADVKDDDVQGASQKIKDFGQMIIPSLFFSLP